MRSIISCCEFVYVDDIMKRRETNRAYHELVMQIELGYLGNTLQICMIVLKLQEYLSQLRNTHKITNHQTTSRF